MNKLLIILLVLKVLSFVDIEYNFLGTKELPQEIYNFEEVDEIPKNSNCNAEKDKEALKKCVNNYINKTFNVKFNTAVITKKSLNPGTYRIKMTFIIDENGDIINPAAECNSNDLKKEALRVLKGMPKMIPGKHQGKTVAVAYHFPAVIKKR